MSRTSLVHVDVDADVAVTPKRVTASSESDGDAPPGPPPLLTASTATSPSTSPTLSPTTLADSPVASRRKTPVAHAIASHEQPAPSSSSSSSSSRSTGTPADAASTPGKPRDRTFPLVYVGFILLALAVDGRALFEHVPLGSGWWSRSRVSVRAEQLALVVFSTCVLTPALWALRSAMKRRVFGPMAASWAGLEPGTQKHAKFAEQGWLAFHYSWITALELYVLSDKPWWPPLVSASSSWALAATPEARAQDQRDAGIAVVYAVQLGFYTLELATLAATPRRELRSDAVVYLFHHVYTTLLLSLSWLTLNHRIGTIVLVLHDCGDIWLPVGKMYSYAEEHIRRTRSKAMYEFHKAVGTGFFAVFIASFMIPRLVVFGGVIRDGCTFNRWFTVCRSPADGSVLAPGPGVDPLTVAACADGGAWGPAGDVTLMLTLMLLYPMHVFWGLLILKMAYRVLFVEAYDDVRSDDE